MTATAVTATNGSFSFAGLRPGTYTITETPPAGYFDGKDALGSLGGTVGKDTFTAVAVPTAASGANYDFAEFLPSSLSGYVYNDANNNGVMDSGEAGIAGVTVTLSGTNDLGAITATAVTAANGSYSFASLRPGTYTITETPPAGYFDGKDALGSLGGTVGKDMFTGVAVATAGSGVNYDFAEFLPSSLSGFVYNDANDNGVMDSGEAGIAGVMVTLSGTNDLGAVTATAVTAANGSFSFAGLRPGTYSITETSPAGYFDGKDALGSLGGTVGKDTFTGVTVATVASGVNYDFAEFLPSSLSGYVCNDANNNGVMDSGEAGIAGVTVTLTGTNDLGAVTATAVTAANGSYSFAGLRPGTYSITETPPTGYFDGKDALGSLGGTVGKDTFTAVAVATAANGANYDFAEFLPSSLSGFVYNDANNNGVMDSGEAGIAGVTVTLSGTNDLGAVTATAVTAANGSFSFAGLRPGTYSITETPPAGYFDGKDALGSLGGTVGKDTFTGVTVATAASGVNYDFAEFLPSSLSGYVYNDANNNGVMDSGEAGIAGVTVTLTGTNDLGAVTATAVTAANGSYSFAGLRPGTYSITETPPTGYFDGKDALGSLGGTVGKDTFTAVAVATAANGANYDFAEFLPSSLSGYVYNDANNNGVMDSGEAGIAGVTVTLSGTNDLGESRQPPLPLPTDRSASLACVPEPTASPRRRQPGTLTVRMPWAAWAGRSARIRSQALRWPRLPAA